MPLTLRSWLLAAVCFLTVLAQGNDSSPTTNNLAHNALGQPTQIETPDALIEQCYYGDGALARQVVNPKDNLDPMEYHYTSKWT